MLKIVDDPEAILKYQQRLVKTLKPYWDEKIPVKIGHPGANFAAKIFYSMELGLWMYSRAEEGFFWNAFGTGRPREGASLSITCEINFPTRGIDRKIGGGLAKDGKGRIYVVHRGKIGGGKKGVGKALFEKHYRGVWAVMEDGDAETPVALIGALSTPRFIRQLVSFVRKVDRIKGLSAPASPQLEIGFEEGSFSEEFTGMRYCELERDLERESDYVLVVSDLASSLTRRGLRVRNDSVRDL
ncbi:MAG: hypothetical protein PHY31_00385, partial [Smithellaceae bacterium]|nr:hypothetical protein [Smithellaceae bacterium]